MMALVQSYARGASVDRAPVELVVRRGGEDLAELEDGSWVSAETARRLGCDAGVVEITEGANGEPLSVGRKRRTIPAPMKRALLNRDRTCRFPGCSNRLFLDGHHAQHWADGGDTSLPNLVTLCTRHHAFVHEHGHRVVMEDNQPIFFTPRGRRVEIMPPRPCLTAESLGWPTIEAENAELEIGPMTGQAHCDPDAIDYGYVIDRLVCADRLNAT